jgi:hypothetical protein
MLEFTGTGAVPLSLKPIGSAGTPTPTNLMMSASLWWVPASLPAHFENNAEIRPTAANGDKYFCMSLKELGEARFHRQLV